MDLSARPPDPAPGAHRPPRRCRPGAGGRRLNRYNREIQAEGSPKYSPQAQSSPSSGLAAHHPGGQKRLLIIVRAGPIHRATPMARRARITQPKQGGCVLPDLAVNVREISTEPHLHRRQPGPSLTRPRREALTQRRLRRLRDLHPPRLRPPHAANRHQRTYAEGPLGGQGQAATAGG
jgi:hypothetical protein